VARSVAERRASRTLQRNAAKTSESENTPAVNVKRITQALSEDDAVQKLSDEHHNEADYLAYFYDIARDHVTEAKKLLDSIAVDDVSSESVKLLAEGIEDVMSRLFSDMQYPRSYRWFIRHDPSDLP